MSPQPNQDPPAVTDPAPAGHSPVEVEEVATRMVAAVGRLVRQLRRVRMVDVTPGALSALFTLRRTGPQRLGDLALREGVSPPTLTRIVASLEEAGYVRRSPDPDDRRAVQVEITESGEALTAGAGAAALSAVTTRLAELTPQQIGLLSAALPALEALVAADD